MLKSCYVPCHVHARCRRTCSYERNRERAVRIQPLLSARRKYRGWMHHKTHAHSHTSLLAADDVQASGFYPFPVVDAVRLHQGDKLCLCTPMDSTFRNGVAPDPLFAQVRTLPTCKYCSCRTRICMHGVSRTSSWTDVSKPVSAR